jgi:beta-phosphoglucomutase
LFDVVVDGNHLTLSKPDPEVFLKGAEALDLQPGDVVVFEDAVSGVQAAKTGGFFAVGVGDPNQLSQADVVVPNLEGVNPAKLREWQSE